MSSSLLIVLFRKNRTWHTFSTSPVRSLPTSSDLCCSKKSSPLPILKDYLLSDTNTMQKMRVDGMDVLYSKMKMCYKLELWNCKRCLKTRTHYAATSQKASLKIPLCDLRWMFIPGTMWLLRGAHCITTTSSRLCNIFITRGHPLQTPAIVHQLATPAGDNKKLGEDIKKCEGTGWFTSIQ